MSWDSVAFLAAVNATAQKGMCYGQDVRSKEDVYRIIAARYNYAPASVHNWARLGSPGPYSNSIAQRIMRDLGCECETIVNDFIKGKLYELHCEILDEIEQQKERLLTQLLRYRICIPHQLYEDICAHVAQIETQQEWLQYADRVIYPVMMSGRIYDQSK